MHVDIFDPMSTSLGFEHLNETVVPTTLTARPGSLESRTFNEDSTDWLMSGYPHETVQFNNYY